MAAKEAKWVEIGKVGVDAGMLMIGDPCYFIGDEAAARHPFPTWDRFIAAQQDREGPDFELLHQIEFRPGSTGLGVVAATAHGDGLFTVYALKADKTDRTQALLVITGDMEPPV